MQIGFVGLGKMGGSMVQRILRDSDHQVVALDFSPDAVKQAESHGATGASELAELVKKLEAPRHVWLMIPSGAPTQQTIQDLYELLDEGDTIIDGGNSRWTDSAANGAAAEQHGIEFVDVGTSGGVWGLEVGYCMMVGGSDKAVSRLAPILDVLAPPDGWGHMGSHGAGPLREDGPQRRGVRDDAGLRRGLRDHARLRLRARHGEDREPLDAGLGRALVAARAGSARVRAGGLRPGRHPRLRRGLRRGPLDGVRRDRQERAGAGHHALADAALLVSPSRSPTRRR